MKLSYKYPHTYIILNNKTTYYTRITCEACVTDDEDDNMNIYFKQRCKK